MTYPFEQTWEVAFDAAVDPLRSMQAVDNPLLAQVASTAQAKFARAVNLLTKR